MAKIRLEYEKRDDGWWLVGSPNPEADSGPYKSKDDAREDKVGLEHFWNVLWPETEAQIKAEEKEAA